MSGMREDIARLKQLLPDPVGAATGLVPTVSTFVDSRGITQYTYTLTAVAPGSAQTKITFEYNTVALGTTGTVDTFNVVSNWVNFTRATDTVTLTIPTPSGGTTGLTFTAATGSLTLGGTLAIANGGTGQTTANAALNALLPTQSGHATEVLTTDGTNATWQPSGGGGTTDTALVWTVGTAGGPSILATQFDVGQTPGVYTVTGWRLQMDRTGAFSVEVQRATAAGFPAYATMSGTSTSTGGLPQITSGQNSTSSDVSLWSATTLALNDSIRLIIHANTAAPGWFSLSLLVTRTL